MNTSKGGKYPGHAGHSLLGIREPGAKLEKDCPKPKAVGDGFVGPGQKKGSAWPGQPSSLPKK